MAIEAGTGAGDIVLCIDCQSVSESEISSLAAMGGEMIKNASGMGTDTTSNGYKEVFFALVSFWDPGLASQNRRLCRFRSCLFLDPLFRRSLDALQRP